MDRITLIKMAQQKNDINRRRRRFYYYITLMSPRPRAYKFSPQKTHLTLTTARVGYWKAKADGVLFGKALSKARREIKASFIWGDSGNIRAIRFNDNTKITAKEFATAILYHDCELYLLGAKVYEG